MQHAGYKVALRMSTYKVTLLVDRVYRAEPGDDARWFDWCVSGSKAISTLVRADRAFTSLTGRKSLLPTGCFFVGSSSPQAILAALVRRKHKRRRVGRWGVSLRSSEMHARLIYLVPNERHSSRWEWESS